MKLFLSKSGLHVASLAFFTVFSSSLFGQNIVPNPAFSMPGNGEFVFEKTVEIAFASPAEKPVFELLKAQLATLGIQSKKGKTAKAATSPRIELLTDTALFKNPEAYGLIVTPEKVILEAGGPIGHFYACQSLFQLLPTEKATAFPRIASIKIEDAPRFGWRGLHLDCARHFMPLEFIKKLLDAMAAYKLNRFHWHLTDDQGWRLEIKKWPKLTSVGAFRPGTAMQFRTDEDIVKNGHDNRPHGGFYTQKQASEIVAYAKKLHIEVLPEIEMPGHCLAALAAYPELSCHGRPLAIGLRRGGWDDVFCPTEKTFAFLDDVLGEVAAIFPSDFIHIGGDEVSKKQWLADSFAIRFLGLDTLGITREAYFKKKDIEWQGREIHGRFLRRVAEIVAAKGKKMIGWDEILDEGAPADATVMSWRGESGGIRAANAGRDVIMSPGFAMYFDFYQGPPSGEPKALCCFSDLEKVYRYEPIAPKIKPENARHILGVQANVWTEMIPDPAQAEYMIFPRTLALSEVAWSQPSKRDFDRFLSRMENQWPRLEKRGLNFRIPPPVGMSSELVLSEKVPLLLSKSLKNSQIELLENEKPSLFSTEKAVEIPLEKGQKRLFTARSVLPDGRKSPFLTFELERPEPPFPAMETRRFRKGASARVWDGKYEAAVLIPSAGGNELILDEIVPPRDVFYLQAWAAEINFFLRIDEPGSYEFSLRSPDIVTVELAGKQLFYVARETEKVSEQTVQIDSLARDLHPMKVRTSDAGGSKRFELKYRKVGETAWRKMAGDRIYYE